MERRIADNVAAVHDQIAAAARRAGRDPATINLVAVTKSQGPDVLPALAACGVCDYGENRTAHLMTMAAAAPSGARFHYIGRVQGRQLADVAEHCVALHSLCQQRHVARLARACRERQRRLPVFLQVNTGGEDQKAGADPHELDKLLADCAEHQDAISVIGLMCMAPDIRDSIASTDPVRRCFATLRELADTYGLPRLSMGMSTDFTIAIEEGATDIRVGSRLFA
ncbi:MAG: YggS family pyridoxal phosphate-dependent enzyme [Planctomycetota bacterium]